MKIRFFMVADDDYNFLKLFYKSFALRHFVCRKFKKDDERRVKMT